MKKRIFSVIGMCILYSNSQAQIINDTVTTAPTYANNIWYSLANDDQASNAINTWHIGFATVMGATDALTTSVLFNHKMGTVYEVPNSDPSDFANVDTTGFSAWTPLYNSDESWAKGAFNNTVNLGAFDYGWGNYNMTTHGIDANRVFVIKLTAGGFYKLMINSTNPASTYTLVFDALDNTDLTTETIDVTAYTSKNFVYYNLSTKVIVDREPVSENWDLYFHQYPSFDYDPPYMVTGIFQNVGVEVAKAYPIDDVFSYEDFSSESFNNTISTIGYDWKSFNGMSFEVVDSTVYFVSDQSGDVWKMIMTGFEGSSSGKYLFSKEKISTIGLSESDALCVSVYPNPASETATIVLKNAPEATIEVYTMTGDRVQMQHADASVLTAVSLNTADLANGVYQVLISTATSATSQKLIIQH